jgi:hypothetical protein
MPRSQPGAGELARDFRHLLALAWPGSDRRAGAAW